jgi:hypothetical protein
MAAHKDKARGRIKAAFGEYAGIVAKARGANSNNADTRTVVCAVVSEMLGWDPLEHLTVENRMGDYHTDYMLRDAAGALWASRAGQSTSCAAAGPAWGVASW